MAYDLGQAGGFGYGPPRPGCGADAMFNPADLVPLTASLIPATLASAFGLPSLGPSASGASADASAAAAAAASMPQLLNALGYSQYAAALQAQQQQQQAAQAQAQAQAAAYLQAPGAMSYLQALAASSGRAPAPYWGGAAPSSTTTTTGTAAAPSQPCTSEADGGGGAACPPPSSASCQQQQQQQPSSAAGGGGGSCNASAQQHSCGGSGRAGEAPPPLERPRAALPAASSSFGAPPTPALFSGPLQQLPQLHYQQQQQQQLAAAQQHHQQQQQQQQQHQLAQTLYAALAQQNAAAAAAAAYNPAGGAYGAPPPAPNPYMNNPYMNYGQRDPATAAMAAAAAAAAYGYPPAGMHNPYGNPYGSHAAAAAAAYGANANAYSAYAALQQAGAYRQPQVPQSTASLDMAEDEYGDDGTARAVKRPRLVWTPQLHKKFEIAVQKLGVDKAVPKNIMQEMNIDGLTRENVASHLQKYRMQIKRDTGTSSSGDRADAGCCGSASVKEDPEGSDPKAADCGPAAVGGKRSAAGSARPLPRAGCEGSSAELTRTDSGSGVKTEGAEPPCRPAAVEASRDD